MVPPHTGETGSSLPHRNGGGSGWGPTHYLIELSTFIREGAAMLLAAAAASSVS